MDKEINILEALTGLEFSIMHLDGKIIPIKGQKGQIIIHEQRMRVKGHGMPIHNGNGKKGNLFITFVIALPEEMSET
jgi:DnaJ family protein A protein 2